MGGCSKNKDDPDKDVAKDVSDRKKATKDALDGTEIRQDAAAGEFDVGEEVRSFLVVFEGEAAADSDLIAEHQRYLGRLAEDGRLERFGSFAGGGGMVLIAAANEAEARELIARDPLVSRGVHSDYSLREVFA